MNIKRAYKKGRMVRIITGLFFACSFIVLNTGCGLDVYYFLYAPVCNDVNEYTNTDQLEDYFIFKTAQSGNYDSTGTSAFVFSGTQIYYKIYSNYKEMESRASTISKYIDNANSSSSSTSATAAMDQLKSWGYQTLKFKYAVNTPDPLIQSNSSTSNQYVYIRLVNYGENSTDYHSAVCVGSEAMSKCDSSKAFKDSSGNILSPLRSVMDSSGSDYMSFAFDSDGSQDKYKAPPSSTDEDVCYTTFSEDDTWYVDLYAVSIGLDSATYSEYYSQPTYLGSMTIKEEAYSSF